MVRAGAPIDGFGVGTSLTTSPTCRRSTAPTSSRNMPGCRGASARTARRPGRGASRSGAATARTAGWPATSCRSRTISQAGEPLIQPVMRSGRRLAPSRRWRTCAQTPRTSSSGCPRRLRRLQPGTSYPVQVADALVRLPTEVDRRLAAAERRADDDENRDRRQRRLAGRRHPERLLSRGQARGAARRRGGAARQPLGARFRHVVLTQDWHPPGHLSFASAHPGRKPYETIEVAYGPQILWPDHCVQGTPGAQFRDDLHIPHAAAGPAQGLPPRRSIPIRRSTRTTARPRPGSPAICANAGSRACSWPASRSTSACAIRPRMRTAKGFEVVVVEDACRGIDVDGSVAATRRRFAALDIAAGVTETPWVDRPLGTPGGGPT